MSIYQQRPWLARYDDGQPADIQCEYPSMVDAWRASVRRAPDNIAIHYFDGVITVSELDGLSDAFGVALSERGIRRGDRVGVYLQNVPQFVITLLAVWKIGAIAVSINPMNKQRELTTLLTDSGSVVLICLESLYDKVAREVVGETEVRLVITTSELEYQNRDDRRVLGEVRRARHDGTEDMAEMIAAHRGRSPDAIALQPEDIAMLTYTSGTTGPPKGAMNTHGNFVFNAQTYRDWISLGPSDVILGVAPLFHITGLVGHLALALLNPSPLVLTYRFEPALVAEAIEEHSASFTVGSITVFIAMMNAPSTSKRQLATLSKIYSGGAPIPPSVVAQFRDKFDHYIHNIYGLTETNSPSHAVPLHAAAPIDSTSGALSVGVPVYNTVVRIVGEDGKDLPAGEIGELVTSGPVVVPGYWNKPEETSSSLPGGALH
ncbi:MAG: class I adenylate-forming enzyme family protein, partial [Sciscionella sp.]